MSLNNLPEEFQDRILNEDEFLEAELQMGIGFHNREFITMCLNVANNFTKYPDIKTVIDFGAGTGVYSKAFYTLGYQVLAIEKFASHRDYIKRNASMIPVYSIEEWLEAGTTDTDLLVWMEVAEHMSDEDIDMVFELINAKYIFFSSTSEVTDQDEAWGHINVKTQAQWNKIFKDKGYRMVEEPGGPTAWAKVFKKI